jgi:hypothetical protein
VDNDLWLAAMAESGRCTAVCLEYCGDGDPHPRLAASQSYLDDRMRRLAAALADY